MYRLIVWQSETDIEGLLVSSVLHAEFILFIFNQLRNQTPMDDFSSEKAKWPTFRPGIPLSPILPGMPSRP